MGLLECFDLIIRVCSMIRKVFSILGFISGYKVQFSISFIIPVCIFILSNTTRYISVVGNNYSISNFISVMGVVSVLITLASSVSYSHTSQHISSNQSKMRDSYKEFKERTFDLYNFVRSNNFDDELELMLIDLLSSMMLSTRKDIPFSDIWHEKAEEITNRMDSIFEGERRRPRHLELTARMVYCEEMLDELHIQSIAQMISFRFTRPILKSLFIISIVVSMSVIFSVLGKAQDYNVLLSYISIFVCSFSILIFAEIAYYVYKYAYDYSVKHVEE